MTMRSKRTLFTLVTPAANSIVLSQTPSSGVALTMAGALCSGGVLPRQTLGYILLLTTSANDSAKTLAITGLDANGVAQTETCAVPNATTGFSANYWSAITSIVPSATFTGTLTIGTANSTASAVSNTYPVDIYTPNTVVALDVTGTANFTLQKCYERPTAGETPNWITAQAAGAIDVQTVITSSIGAIRLLITSYSTSATIAMSVMQAPNY